MTRWFTRKVEKLVAAFWDWCESVYDEPEERLDPPHEYARPGTFGSFRLGDRCKHCKTRDPKMRAHNSVMCKRSFKELA